ncbi:MAG: DUF5686 family protein [Mongoliitalea sp.]
MNTRFLLVACILYFVGWAFPMESTAQDSSLLKGKVLQFGTDEPIPFAHVYWIGFESQGVVSDILGDFRLRVQPGADTLVFSHVSHVKLKIPVSKLQQDARFFMNSKQLELKEFLFVAGENPALPIVRKAIANKKLNNPSNLSSYRYESYDKMIFTVDGISEDGIRRTKFDTLFDGGHLLVSESLSEVTYKKPGRRHEKVKASQISGLENLLTALVSSTIQPFSFYEDYITLLEIPYLHPMTSDGMRKYDYFLEDSIQSYGTTSYVVSFQPKESKGYLLGTGFMTISQHQYALENIVFSSFNNQSNLQFELQQKNRWDGQYWFPEQINSIYFFKNFDVNGSPMKLVSQNFISDVRLNEPIASKEIPRVGLIYDIQNERYPIAQFRRDSLTVAETRAFSRFEDMDAKNRQRAQNVVRVFSQLLTGRVAVGSVDVLTGHLFRINQHEGLALGLGLATNQQFSRYLELDGYIRYGFRDRAWKYGVGSSILFNDIRESKLRFSYSKDIVEIGANPFLRTQTFATSSDLFRNFLAEKMDAVQRYAIEFSQLPFQNWRLGLTASTESRIPLWTTNVADLAAIQDLYQPFQATQVGLNVRYISKESNSKIGRQILPGPIGYPVLHLHASRAIPDLLNGTADFWRLAFKTQHQWRKGVSTHQLNVEGMSVWGADIPISYFNTGFGIQPQERTFSFSLPAYFQTMRIYEFFSDRAVFANYSYLTGPLFQQTLSMLSIAPQLNLVQSVAIGSMNHSFGDQPFPFQTMEQGYLESGIELQNLIKYRSGFGLQGIGIGAYYRWGAYAHPTFQENVFVNLSLRVAF